MDRAADLLGRSGQRGVELQGRAVLFLEGAPPVQLAATHHEQGGHGQEHSHANDDPEGCADRDGLRTRGRVLSRLCAAIAQVAVDPRPAGVTGAAPVQAARAVAMDAQRARRARRAKVAGCTGSARSARPADRARAVASDASVAQAVCAGAARQAGRSVLRRSARWWAGCRGSSRGRCGS